MWKSSLGRGHSKCKGPGENECVPCLRNSKEASKAGAERRAGWRGNGVGTDMQLLVGGGEHCGFYSELESKWKVERRVGQSFKLSLPTL